MTTHLIQTNTIELTIGEESAGRTIRDEVHRVYTERVVPVMDSVLTDIDRPHSVLRIEKLELNLGAVSLSNLDEDLVAAVGQQLRRSLEEAIARTHETNRDVLGVSRTPLESNLDALEVFLSEGRLPWWFASPASFDPDTFLGDILEREPAKVVSLIRRIMRRRIASRLARQFSPATQNRLIGAASGGEASSIEREAAIWTELLEGNRAVSSGAALVREEVIRATFADSPLPVGSRLSDRIVARVGSQYSVPPSELARDLGESAATLAGPGRRILDSLSLPQTDRAGGTGAPDSGDNQTRPSDITDHGSHPAEGRPDAPEAAAQSRRHLDSQGPDDLQKSRREAARRRIDRPAKNSGQSTMSKDARRDIRIDPEPVDASHKDPVAVEEPASRETREESILPDDEALYIENAGLVLTWPYLVRFFRHLGLLDSDSFRSQDCRERAVLLLEHLGTGLQEWPEQQLPLNKILCGWPLAEPVARRISISKDELKESEDLLSSIIDNWKTLKRTSVEGLRKSFLQREGRLTQQEDGWHLKVARTGFDVLLDQLPWGIGFVLLPWMGKPLFVEW